MVLFPNDYVNITHGVFLKCSGCFLGMFLNLRCSIFLGNFMVIFPKNHVPDP